ncbi:MAG: ABC transporter, partial [Actinobacteria bacterium]|nr:ABC transporter [Actinomycetota bacterium]
MAASSDPTDDSDAPLPAALHALARTLADLPDGLDTPDAPAARAARDRIARDIAATAARARDLDAPLLVVLGGVTGAGKSTTANSLVGRNVVRTGVVRPTTATPTLVVHPDDAHWFRGSRVLPGLPRVADATGEVAGEVLVVVEDPAIPPGLALVDAPDVDSVSDANRELADRLLDAADVWVWFTTAGKYADEESMRYVRRAAERHTSMIVALTQVHAPDRDEVLEDLDGKLADAGAAGAQVVVVPWTEVVDGRLPASASAELSAAVLPLAAPEARRAHRRRTLEGALDRLPDDVAQVAGWLDTQLEEARLLTADAATAYARATRDFAVAIEEGLPLQQEVLSRWNRFVGGNRILRLAEEASGQARTWLRSVLVATADSREERLEREVKVEVADTVGDLATRLGDLAAADLAEAWSRRSAGRALLAAEPQLGQASPDLRARTVAEVAAWQDHVVDLVATTGSERRTRARWVSTLVNAAATGAIVVALASTGGLTGAEAGIATAAGAANQTLL